MSCHRLLWLLPVLMLSCASSVSTPLPTAVRAIAVLPPNNRTGDPLLVGGTSLLEKYLLRSPPVTVADVLAVEVRIQLEQRGITVLPREQVDAALGNQIPRSPKDAANLASHGKLEGGVLYIEIVQWQPALAESLHPWRMLVAIHVEERMPQQRFDELVARRRGKLRVVHKYLTLRLCANRHSGALANKLRAPQIPIATTLRSDIGKRVREHRDRVAEIGESRMPGWKRTCHESLIFLPWLAIHVVSSRRLASL